MLSWSDVRREPFRIFFPLGIGFGLVGTGHWLIYALGWVRSYSGFYHASLQVGTYMVCFIIGFLLTAVPRFSGSRPASSVELAAFLLLLASESLFLSIGWWPAAQACFAGLLLTLLIFAGRRFAGRRGEVHPPTEFVWIPASAAMGILGAALLALGQAGLVSARILTAARPLAQQGFLLGIVMGVGGFMGPRLMGHFTPTQQSRSRRVLVHMIAAVLFLFTFFLEGAGALRAAYLLRALIVTAEFAWTARIFRLPRTPQFYVKLLWISLWMIALGLWAAGLWPARRVAMLHLVFLGGFSLMTFAVATMVVLSHGGEAGKLERPLWILWVVAVGVGLAAAARVAADFVPSRYFQHLAAASASWMIAAAIWLLYILPRVARPVSEGEFEQIHEEAKRRHLKD